MALLVVVWNWAFITNRVHVAKNFDHFVLSAYYYHIVWVMKTLMKNETLIKKMKFILCASALHEN